MITRHMSAADSAAASADWDILGTMWAVCGFCTCLRDQTACFLAAKELLREDQVGAVMDLNPFLLAMADTLPCNLKV